MVTEYEWKILSIVFNPQKKMLLYWENNFFYLPSYAKFLPLIKGEKGT